MKVRHMWNEVFFFHTEIILLHFMYSACAVHQQKWLDKSAQSENCLIQLISNSTRNKANLTFDLTTIKGTGLYLKPITVYIQYISIS